VINGKRGISPEMAKLLGDAFDQSPEYWMNLQKMYDLQKAPEPATDIAKRGRLQDVYPVRDMVKRGWLTEEKNGTMLEAELARFFDCTAVNEVPYLQHAAKKTHYEEDKTPPPQVAWLFRVRQIAKTMITPPYSEIALRKAIPQLAALRFAPEETRQVAKILNGCGVRFVVVEALSGAKIDGVCLWLNPEAPVIGMSLQRDYIDNFWFGVRHEIEHVLKRHGLKKECIDEQFETTEQNVSEEERTANAAGAEFCVPQSELENFMARIHPYYSEERIVLFAQRLGIHPGLVVGQLQKRLSRYDLLKKHQAKIRQFVTSAATYDGWGTVVAINS
jgi:HTH-type transcriptional regulator/antitoxin HigA